MDEARQDLAHLFAAVSAAKRKGDRDAEAKNLNAILAADPQNPQALNALGMLHLGNGNAADAERWFKRAIEQDVAEPALWMNLATAQRVQANSAEERHSLEHVLTLDRCHFMAQLRLAELFQRIEKPIQAAEHWRNVLSLSTGMSEIPTALAQTLKDARYFLANQTAVFARHIDQQFAAPLALSKPTDSRRFQTCVDNLLGRRAIYRNECAGLYYPFLPADEFFDDHLFPWMSRLEASTAAIRKELETLMAANTLQLRPYVQQDAGTPENKWTNLDGSLDWGACFLYEYGVRNEAVCDLCPQTIAVLDSLPCADIPGRAPSAFFSILRPGAKIPPHTGVTNTRAIIHLPLIVPAGCGFRVGGETREWKEGKAFGFDDTIEHEAWNNSGSVRAVLIFDVWNPHLSLAEQELLKQFFAAVDESASGIKIQ